MRRIAALAAQVFYPDRHNGALAACPDPIDFRAYTLIDLYEDANAYALRGEVSSTERPVIRNYLGELFSTQRDSNYMKVAQGDHSRSGGQYDIWHAVFGPVGEDGRAWRNIGASISICRTSLRAT